MTQINLARVLPRQILRKQCVGDAEMRQSRKRRILIGWLECQPNGMVHFRLGYGRIALSIKYFNSLKPFMAQGIIRFAQCSLLGEMKMKTGLS